MAKQTTKPEVTESLYKVALSEFSKAELNIKKINNELERKIAELRQSKQDKLDELKKQKDKAFDTVQEYCEANADKLFKGGKKSIETSVGTVGFRLGTPSVKTNGKGITWDVVLDNLRKLKLKRFIRTKEEVDKDELLKARTEEKVVAQFPEIGVKVVQTESFFIDLKTEDTE